MSLDALASQVAPVAPQHVELLLGPGDGHMQQAALLGAHVATVPYKVLKQLVKHPLTDVGLEKFLADWDKVPKSSDGTLR